MVALWKIRKILLNQLIFSTHPLDKRAGRCGPNLCDHAVIIKGNSEIEAMQDLWGTVSKYPRFLIGVILGVILNVFAPIVPLFKKPATAIALVGISSRCRCLS